MEQIMTEATSDCAKSGIVVKYAITEVSYYGFLSEYEPTAGGRMHKAVAETPPEVAHGNEASAEESPKIARSELETYAAESVTPLMNQLMEKLFHDRPDDVAGYIVQRLLAVGAAHGAGAAEQGERV